MSDDLISREYLLNCAEYDDNGRLIIHYRKVKNAPTDFDKEKVIEELNSERNLMYREDGTLMGARTQISIDRAVDIVEKGGTK